MFAYADGPTEEIARQLCNRLSCLLAHELQFHATWLPFTMLDSEAVFLASARMAAEAQLVFFSTCSSQPLPPAVRRWIEAWLPKKAGTDAALVVLLWKEGWQIGLHGPAHRHFRELVRSAGLELFACEFDSANRNRPVSWCGPMMSEMIARPRELRGSRDIRKPETPL